MATAFERIRFIVGAKIDEIISSMEDPIHQIDSAIVDAKIGYSKVKSNGATALAEEARAKKAYEDRNKYIKLKQDIKDLKEEEKKLRKAVEIYG